MESSHRRITSPRNYDYTDQTGWRSRTSYTIAYAEALSSEEIVANGFATGEYAKKVVIAATVGFNGITYKVTAIQKKAFYKDSRITSVSIDKNVTKIGTYAFMSCIGITKLVIGDNVTTIGASAFHDIKPPIHAVSKLTGFHML